jgi:hypothetical protein
LCSIEEARSTTNYSIVVFVAKEKTKMTGASKGSGKCSDTQSIASMYVFIL